LKEAGYNGEKIVVLTPSDPPVQAAAALVTVQNLRKAGVNVDAQAMDWSTLLLAAARKRSRSTRAAGTSSTLTPSAMT